MNSRPRETPPTVYLIADHLDAVLAAGEDLSKVALDLASAARPEEGPAALSLRLREFVEAARRYETALVSRALQARVRAREIAPKSDCGMFLKLFVGATAQLADAAEELADATAADFNSGDDTLAYLRSRGLIADDDGSLAGRMHLAIGGDFLVAKKIPLDDLLTMSAGFLDKLEEFYDIAWLDPAPQTVAAE